MDFKARHPHIKFWPVEEQITSLPFPYNPPSGVCLIQIDAPDDSTKFLAMSGGMTADEKYLVNYLIEAPPGCPMREEFEFGELTWEQFWHHKGWLIECRFDISEGQR